MDNGHDQPKTAPETITNEEAAKWLGDELLKYTAQIPETWREKFTKIVKWHITISMHVEDAKRAMQSESETKKKEKVRYCLRATLASIMDLGLQDISPFGKIQKINGKIQYPKKISELLEMEIYRHTAPGSLARAMATTLFKVLGTKINKYELAKKIETDQPRISALMKKLNDTQDAFQITKYFYGEYLRLEPTLTWLVEMEEKHAAEEQQGDPEVIQALQTELDITRQALAKALHERDDATAKVKKLEDDIAKLKERNNHEEPQPQTPRRTLDHTAQNITIRNFLSSVAASGTSGLMVRTLRAIVQSPEGLTTGEINTQTKTDNTPQEIRDNLTAFAKRHPHIFGTKAKWSEGKNAAGKITFHITLQPIEIS